MADTKNRARIQILSSLLSFPTIRNKDWTSDLGGGVATVGDLVALSSAPASKWYISWVADKQPGGFGGRWLLESIEDGELCWWENIGICYYNRERVAENKHWRWTDKQFAFQDKWSRVAKRNGAYIVLPRPPEFMDDGSVMLNVRVRLSLNEFSNPVVFPSWKKLTSKQMDAYWKETEALYESRRKPEPPQ